MRLAMLFVFFSVCAARDSRAWQAAGPDPQVDVRLHAGGGDRAGSEPRENAFSAYPRYFQDTNDLLLRRAEDGRARNPNPNGSNGGTTPGMSKNNYVLKTYPIRNVNAIDVQSYLLRAVAYEGGIVEVMGRQDVKDTSGAPMQFVFVTAPDFMIPGIDATIAAVDVPGFAFNDGTGNPNAKGQIGCVSYVGRHRTASELRAILIGTELGNVGQLYYSPFADNALNTIYMSENPSDVADDLAALELFDRPPLQAEFEITIFEIDEDSFENVGLDWDAWKWTLSGTGTFRDVTGDGQSKSIDTIITLDASTLANFLNYMVQNGNARIDTAAKVLSINCEDNPGLLSGGAKGLATATPAVLRAVRVLPFSQIVAQSATTGDTRQQSVVDPNVFEGIEVTILPFIATDSITADVSVTVNSLVGFDREQRVPNISTRASRNVVNMRPGTKYLLGSFDKVTQVDAESGIPLLKEIPLLGRLFRHDTTVERHSKLLVFAVPTIIGDAGDAGRVGGVNPGPAPASGG